jgi:hypothetical protein
MRPCSVSDRSARILSHLDARQAQAALRHRADNLEKHCRWHANIWPGRIKAGAACLPLAMPCSGQISSAYPLVDPAATSKIAVLDLWFMRVGFYRGVVGLKAS